LILFTSKAIKIEVHMETFNKINKTGAPRNAADRDHCLQYAVAVALFFPFSQTL